MMKVSQKAFWAGLAFCSLLPQAATASASGIPGEILAGIHQLGYATVTQGDIVRATGGGSNTQSLYHVTIPPAAAGATSRTLICKLLQHAEKKERQHLEGLTPFAQAHEAFVNSIPGAASNHALLATYQGGFHTGEHEYVFFEEATGESAFNAVVERAEQGYDWKGNSYTHMKRSWRYHFGAIGRATANFHLRYGTFDEESSSFRTVLHRDLHLSNVWYGRFSNLTSFIDYETMVQPAETKGNILIDLKRLFVFSREQLEPIIRERAKAAYFALHPRTSIFIDEATQRAADAYVAGRLDIVNDLFQAMAEGYTEAFATAGYHCDITTGRVTRR